jgi:Rps23 Pro-64 3,4-dihydroxylase Tpa1-like proline 4-hydroxylase
MILEIYNKNLFVSKKIEDDSKGIRYLIIDNLFDEEFIKKCESEFFSIGEDNFVKYSNPFFEFEKYTLNNSDKIPENLKILFDSIHSENFVKQVSLVSGIEDLKTDGNRWGGGLHMTKGGGYLSVHKDFNVLPTSYSGERQMLRCMNLIGYLNSEWKSGDGGELEFWDSEGTESIVSVEPKFNRWVLFDTRENFHGHPYPYKGKSPRISIASYYYKEQNIEESLWSSTQYLKLPWMEESEEYKKQREERANPKNRYKTILKK